MRTWDHACIIYVLMFMCAVWKVLWVLVVTLSLVSCSVSPRRRNTLGGHVVIGVVLGFTTQTQHQMQSSFLLDFGVHLCTCSQTVFRDRQFSSVANYCTLLHRENGSFEVLSLLESTTKSRSSSLRVDASRHLFSEGDENVALFFSFWIFETLLASFHTPSRAPCSCDSVSSWDRSSNFGALGLRWWGSPGQIIPNEGFWTRILVWRAIAFVNFTRWIGFCMSDLFRKIDDNFGGSISWKTQPNCRVFDELHPTSPWPCAWCVSWQTTGFPVLSCNSCFFSIATGCRTFSCQSFFFNMATALLSSLFLDLLLGCSSI